MRSSLSYIPIVVSIVSTAICLFGAGCVFVLARKYSVRSDALKASRTVSREADQDFESALAGMLKAEHMETNLRYLTKQPHVAGSQRNNELAKEIARRWTDYGFDKVEMPRYDILMSLPDEKTASLVTLVDGKGNVKLKFNNREKPLIPMEKASGVMPSILSFTPSGTEIGEVVYVNYGMAEDFDKLIELNIPIQGRIALIRQGRVFRGNKVHNAATNGAIGALIYTDPADFAPEGSNKTFPATWWLPESGLQRGVGSLETGPGDILTPGYPSTEGIYRLPLDKVNTPKIPAYELSYGDALQILRQMKGPKAPEPWQGKLPITYKLGPGFTEDDTKVKMVVRTKYVTKPIYNVIGTIKGKEEPDRYVIMGNHRDAWVFGASDPSSGTAILMELSRGLGDLLKTGWRPRRTIMLCSWDAEEQFVSGSTEWVEENAQLLINRAVVYLNIDIGVGGNFTLNTDGGPLIEDLLISTAKEVQDPTSGSRYASLYDIIVERDARKLRAGVPVCDNLAFGSDYVSFYHFLGITSGDWSYIFGGTQHGIRRSYPLYHSVHDNFYWMKNFVDPHFKIHLAVGQYASRVLMKIADSTILPFNTSSYVALLKTEFEVLKGIYSLRKHSIDLQPLSKSIDLFDKSSMRFEVSKKAALVESKWSAQRVINDQVSQLERVFIDTLTPNAHVQFRHVVYGPDWSNIYHGVYFPHVKEAISKARKSGDWDRVKREISVVTFCVQSAARLLEPVAEL